MGHPPRDRGQRRGGPLRSLVQPPAAAAGRAQAPAAVGRFPEVLLVAHPGQARPQVRLPVELQLSRQGRAPVDRHGRVP